MTHSEGAYAGAFLVKDINVAGGNSYPQHFVAVKDRMFFTADDGMHGTEVWSSDGTVAGTRLTQDVRPGLASSYPDYLTAAESLLYFVAEAGLDGCELWRSDGTEAGTFRITTLGANLPEYEIRLAAVGDALIFRRGSQLWRTDGTVNGPTLLVDANALAGDVPVELAAQGDQIFFSTHTQLWVTDGTAAGTTVLRTFAPTIPGGSSIEYLSIVGGRLFFVADDGIHGFETWSSDGTAGGTTLFLDLIPGDGSAAGIVFAQLDQAFLLRVSYGEAAGLWRTDGTAAGTVRLAAVTPSQSVRVGNDVFFMTLGPDFVGGWDLWRTDGTEAGTHQIAHTLYSSIAAFEDSVFYFSGFQGGCSLVAVRAPLYLSNVVANIYASDESPVGTCSDNIGTASGGVYFSAEDERGYELWHSDGTARGTRLLADINASTRSSSPYSLFDVDGRLMFVADDQVHGPELWRSDGTATGTQLVIDLDPGTGWGVLRILAALNGRALLEANAGASGRFLWSSDGSAAGTQLLAAPLEIAPPFGLEGALALFVGSYPPATVGIWRTDGTPTGTFELANGVAPTTAAVDVDGRWLFGVLPDPYHASTPQLWSSDGTIGNATPLADVAPSAGFARWNNRAFFAADDGIHGLELWSTDGTSAGTVLVRDIEPGVTGSNPGELTPMPQGLFFVATTQATGRELWMTDGTAAGTVPVADIYPGPVGSDPTSLAALNGVVVFVARDPQWGVELWRSDGTAVGTTVIRDIKPGPPSSFPLALRTSGRRAYFAAHDGEHGWEVWRTDGSTAGTAMVADIDAGGPSAFFTRQDQDGRRVPSPQFVGVDESALFVADDGVHGLELWHASNHDATLVEDVAPGPLSSLPAEVVVSGSNVYFSALNLATGRELWAVSRADLGAPCVGDCDRRGEVSVVQLIQGVRIVMGDVPLSTCPSIDADGDGTATIDELVSAVGNALYGCQAFGVEGPAPDPIETVTPRPTRPPPSTPTPGQTGNCRRTGCLGEVCADHEIYLPDGFCTIVPEYFCLDTASCELVDGNCAFVLVAADGANRCLAALGRCVFDQDCNRNEICQHDLDRRLDVPSPWPYGVCAPAAAAPLW